MVECVNCAKFKWCDLSSPNVNECADYKETLTNEEWFASLPTEEKAKVLNDLYWGFGYKAKLYYNLEPAKESFEKWLKQPHKEN